MCYRSWTRLDWPCPHLIYVDKLKQVKADLAHVRKRWLSKILIY